MLFSPLYSTTKHPAYDCEFVALAQRFGVKVVSTDRRLLRAFPEHTIPMTQFSEN